MSTEKIGILRPFRVSSNGDVATGSGDELRKSRLETLIGMRGPSAGRLGELEWDHSRGNKLEALLNSASNPALLELAAFHTDDLLAEQMPDERLVSLDVEADREVVTINAAFQRASEGSATTPAVRVRAAIRR